MILQAGKTDVQRLLAGHADGKKFTHIVVGTSNTPVVDSDTSLTGQLSKAITTVDYAPGYVQFNSTLESSDPAMAIQEIGLLNEDGDLMYRKVIPTMNKVAGTTYAFSYRIKVQ